MAYTAPGTAVAGDVLTAAFWNSNVRDNITELAGAPFARNLIQNGAMTVCQRATSTSFGTGGGTAYYASDRFHLRNFTWSAGSNITISQDSSVYPTGFRNSLKVATGATGLTFASGGVLGISHKIEGYDIARAYSSTMTLSFWVRSSVTGTYSISFTNKDVDIATVDRIYVAAYTISVANTWEQKTISIDMASATASGTWDATNGIGLHIEWGLGSNADRRTDAYNSGFTNWSGSSIGWQRTTQTQWATNSNATFYLTGVQLETGSVATPFEFLPYGEDLRRCQRYFYRWTINTTYGIFAFGRNDTTTQSQFVLQAPVPFRAAITGINVSGALSVELQAVTGTNMQTSSVSAIAIGTTVGAGLTAGAVSRLIANNNASTYIEASADL
jgi:hypothetical protein